MTMSPAVRKLALTAHVTASVGWLGSVVGFLGLAVVGLASQDRGLVRGSYLVMEPLGWFVLVPMSLASLGTGLVQALGTPWGLFRHYWVVMKLVMNVAATAVLLLYMQTLRVLADRAADTNVSSDSLRSPSPLLHAGLALVLLVAATGLSVYKPRGLTQYGQRKRSEQPYLTAG